MVEPHLVVLYITPLLGKLFLELLDIIYIGHSLAVVLAPNTTGMIGTVYTR